MSKRGEKQTSKALSPQEIREAEEEVVLSCQREEFSNEYKALMSGKPIPSKSPLINLNPVLDEEGCIRSNGRLHLAEYLPYDVRFPKVLPRGQNSLSKITMDRPVIPQVPTLSCHKSAKSTGLLQLVKRSESGSESATCANEGPLHRSWPLFQGSV